MPAKASGEIKTRVVRQIQKNGDIYIIERQTIYDPDRKYNKVLSGRIISKIPKGGDVPIPTRPKRHKGEKASNSDAASGGLHVAAYFNPRSPCGERQFIQIKI